MKGGEAVILVMDEQQNKEILESLVEFVKRVSKGGINATPEEIQVLPEIAKILFGIAKYDV